MTMICLVCTWHTESKSRISHVAFSSFVCGVIFILVSHVDSIPLSKASELMKSHFSELEQQPVFADVRDEINPSNSKGVSLNKHHRSKRSYLFFRDLPPNITGTWRDGDVCAGAEKNTIMCANTVESLDKLKNCSVIEGNLEIKWMNSRISGGNYTGVEFPKLLEITGYLLFYRVDGLNSIGQLFPNLRAIRGHEVFYEYSLVLYENKDITSISLSNLHYLGTSVVAMINPQLCYISDHVDWLRIVATKKMPTVFSNRVKENGCDLVDGCPKHCAKCWDMDSCQKDCDRCKSSSSGHNPGCDENGNCCHEQCLGGCAVTDSPFECYACKRLRHQGECVERCPDHLYEFQGRRCLNTTECLSENSLNLFHEGKCVSECPQNWIDHSNLTTFPEELQYHVCVNCKGTCDKVCQGRTLVTAGDSIPLKGCTIINGFLEIVISNMESNLTLLHENLALLREVVGYVKVVRSPYISTLNFLKNLRLIRGLNVDSEGNTIGLYEYALYMMNNDNLVSLWDLDPEHPLTIDNGGMFIQVNRRLCYTTIKRLLYGTVFNGKVEDKESNNGSMIRISADTHDDYVISNKTNGQFGDCFEKVMSFEVGYNILPMPFQKHLAYNFSEFNTTDKRQIISYVIYYRAIEDGATADYFRSGGGYQSNKIVWKQMEVAKKMTADSKSVYHYIERMPTLAHFTRYATYVQTFTTLDRGTDGTRSEIIYFTTKPAKPESPAEVVVTPVSDGLEVQWEPPRNPNGVIETYRVHYRLQPWRIDLIYRKDFCNEVYAIEDEPEESVTEAPPPRNVSDLCDCSDTEEGTPALISDKKYISALRTDFENYLQNRLFLKQPGKSLRPRSEVKTSSITNEDDEADFQLSDNVTSVTYELLPSTVLVVTTTVPAPEEKPVTETADITVASSITVYANRTSVLIFNLLPQTEYSIEVEACQAYDKVENVTRCSKRSLAIALTQTDPTLDVIDSSTFAIKKIKAESGEIASLNFTWDPPKQTNGPILKYVITYSKVNEDGAPQSSVSEEDENSRSICINAVKFINNNNSFIWVNTLQYGAKYAFKVRMSTVGTKIGEYTSEVVLEIESPSGTEELALMISLPVCLVIVISSIIVSIVCYRLKKKKPLPPSTLINTFNQDYLDTENMYVPDEWEVERCKVKLGITLGQGSFGMVYEGEAKDLPFGDNKSKKVAVKTVNESATIQDRINFLNEASTMKTFECHHIVKLLGVVSQGQPTLVIMELMDLGDLKSYLRMHRPDEPDNDGRRPPTLREILQMAAEIADGMAYLSDRRFVHRDLAARNCMVSFDMTVKIGDFGMTRDIYDSDYYRKGGKGMLPVRWMAPESLRDGIYTSKSDVWSYGVVLWEMATLAAQPYQGFSNEEVLKFVLDDRVMEMPDGCPDRLFDMMTRCWQYFARNRPSFTSLLNSLQGDVRKNFFSVSWYYSQRGDKSDTDSDNVNHNEPRHAETPPLDVNELELNQAENLRGESPPPSLPARPSRKSLSESSEGSTSHDEFNDLEDARVDSPLLPNDSRAPSSVVSAGKPLSSYQASLDQSAPSRDPSIWSAEGGSRANSCNGSAGGHIHYGEDTLTSQC